MARIALDLGTLEITRYIPVKGEYQEFGVPKTVTVPTGNRLVYNVLHDPPGSQYCAMPAIYEHHTQVRSLSLSLSLVGGLSTATWAEGTELSIHLTLDGHYARSWGSGISHGAGLGIATGIEASIAPFGLGVTTLAIDGELEVTAGWDDPGNTPTDAGGGGRSNGFEISFTLSKEITTSDDPSTAGRASDIIVGGGVELQVRATRSSC
jgi:hypothetical protein